MSSSDPCILLKIAKIVSPNRSFNANYLSWHLYKTRRSSGGRESILCHLFSREDESLVSRRRFCESGQARGEVLARIMQSTRVCKLHGTGLTICRRACLFFSGPVLQLCESSVGLIFAPGLTTSFTCSPPLFLEARWSTFFPSASHQRFTLESYSFVKRLRAPNLVALTMAELAIHTRLADESRVILRSSSAQLCLSNIYEKRNIVRDMRRATLMCTVLC